MEKQLKKSQVKGMYKKIIIILSLIGLMIIASFIVFYGFHKSVGFYSFRYVFMYLFFPMLALFFLIALKYKPAAWFSIIGNFIRIFLYIGAMRWLVILFIAPVFIVPQIVFIKHLNKHKIIQKGKKVFFIINSIVLFIIYGIFISFYIFLLASTDDAASNLTYLLRLIGALSQILIYVCIIFKFVEPIDNDSLSIT